MSSIKIKASIVKTVYTDELREEEIIKTLKKKKFPVSIFNGEDNSKSSVEFGDFYTDYDNYNKGVLTPRSSLYTCQGNNISDWDKVGIYCIFRNNYQPEFYLFSITFKDGTTSKRSVNLELVNGNAVLMHGCSIIHMTPNCKGLVDRFSRDPIIKIKEFNSYNGFCEKSDKFKYDIHRSVYYSMGLCGETGEYIDKIKKIHRDKKGKFSEEDKKSLALELGDALWYLTMCANSIGYSLEYIANLNMKKIIDRMENGTLSGEGDER